MRYYVDDTFATVSGRMDIDLASPEVVLCPNRDGGYPESEVEIAMSPRTARLLARRLNMWAKLLDSVR